MISISVFEDVRFGQA